MTDQAASARRRKIARTVLGRGAIYFFLSLFAFLMVFPFLYMAASSLKTPADTFRYPPKILPRQPEVLEVDGEERTAGQTMAFITARVTGGAEG